MLFRIWNVYYKTLLIGTVNSHSPFPVERQDRSDRKVCAPLLCWRDGALAYGQRIGVFYIANHHRLVVNGINVASFVIFL